MGHLFDDPACHSSSGHGIIRGTNNIGRVQPWLKAISGFNGVSISATTKGPPSRSSPNVPTAMATRPKLITRPVSLLIGAQTLATAAVNPQLQNTPPPQPEQFPPAHV